MVMAESSSSHLPWWPWYLLCQHACSSCICQFSLPDCQLGVWHLGSCLTSSSLHWLLTFTAIDSFQYARLVINWESAILSALAFQSCWSGFLWGSLLQCHRYPLQGSGSLFFSSACRWGFQFFLLGLHLYDREFHLCLQYWLGIPLTDDVAFSVCGIDTNGSGDHQVSCWGNEDLIYRHDSLRDVLYRGVFRGGALGARAPPCT